MKPLLLALNILEPEHQAQIAQHFDLIYAPDDAMRAAMIAERGKDVQAVLTIGMTGLCADEMDAMPKLELVCAMGVGYERIDVAHAHAKGIIVANGAGTNADCVADHAMGILIAAVRGIVRSDTLCRQGVWRTAMGLPPNVSHKRMGIYGLGTIGKKIARRAQAFDIEVAYHNRKPRIDTSCPHFDSLLELAAWSDYLVLCVPGGEQTHHVVTAEVLKALGSKGILVNIARGSLIDTKVLAQALQEGDIAAAALDVYESEPNPPQELIDMHNVVITPHQGGWSPEAVQNSVDRFIENASRHFRGMGVVSPV